MSWTSPLTVASTIRPLPPIRPVVGLLHVRLQVGDCGLHHLGGLQHERQLHLPGTEQLTDGLHTGQQVVVDDLQRRLLRHRLVEVALQAVAFTVDDAPRQPLEQRQRGQFGGTRLLRRRRRHALEQSASTPAAGRIRHGGGRRPDPGRRCAARPGIRFIGRIFDRVHDRRVQPRHLALVQEHRVEHLPRGRVQAERDVG